MRMTCGTKHWPNSRNKQNNKALDAEPPVASFLESMLTGGGQVNAVVRRQNTFTIAAPVLRPNVFEHPVTHHLCVRMLRVRDELLLRFPSISATPHSRRYQRRLSMDLRSTACGFVPDRGNAALPRHSIVDLVAGRHLCRSGHRRDTLVRFDDGVVGVDRKIAVESIVLQEPYPKYCNTRDEIEVLPPSSASPP